MNQAACKKLIVYPEDQAWLRSEDLGIAVRGKSNSIEWFVKDGGSLVGTAGTIDFSTNLSLSPISGGITTVTAATGTSYANSDVDTHLNQSTANAGEVLSWSGSDYDWISNAGYSDSSVDTHFVSSSFLRTPTHVQPYNTVLTFKSCNRMKIGKVKGEPLL